MKTALNLPTRAGKRAARSPFTNGGFSLVEVALAVAIAALAIITLLGLLPQGLEMARKTSQITTSSSILEQVIRNYENMQWTDLPTSTTLKYFTDQGLEVDSSSNEISYVVEINPQQGSYLPATASQELFLKRLIIKVALSSNPSFNFNSTDSKLSYSTFNHLLAKTR